VARQRGDEVAIVGVAGRDDVDAFAAFVERHGLQDVPQIADTDGSVWARFGISGQPSWVFIDGETGARETLFGALGVEGLEQRIDALSG
jgi:peroxiredoxin